MDNKLCSVRFICMTIKPISPSSYYITQCVYTVLLPLICAELFITLENDAFGVKYISLS